MSCQHNHEFPYARKDGAFERTRSEAEKHNERMQSGESKDRRRKTVPRAEDLVLECHPCFELWRDSCVTSARHRQVSQGADNYDFVLFRSRSEFLERVYADTYDHEHSFWFARVNPDLPLDLYLDLEEQTPSPLDTEAIFFDRCQLAIRFVVCALEGIYGLKFQPEVRWLTACASGRKSSFHAHLLGLRFRSVADAREAMARVKQTMDALPEDSGLRHQLRSRSGGWIVDFSVYTPWRNFRMAAQCKRPKRELRANELTGASELVDVAPPRPLRPFDPETKRPFETYDLKQWIEDTSVVLPSYLSANVFALPEPSAWLAGTWDKVVSRTTEIKGAQPPASVVASCLSTALYSVHAEHMPSCAKPPPPLRKTVESLLGELEEGEGTEEMASRAYAGALFALWQGLSPENSAWNEDAIDASLVARVCQGSYYYWREIEALGSPIIPDELGVSGVYQREVQHSVSLQVMLCYRMASQQQEALAWIERMHTEEAPPVKRKRKDNKKREPEEEQQQPKKKKQETPPRNDRTHLPGLELAQIRLSVSFPWGDEPKEVAQAPLPCDKSLQPRMSDQFLRYAAPYLFSSS